jgi:hypothetical protein
MNHLKRKYYKENSIKLLRILETPPSPPKIKLNRIIKET